MTDLGVINRPKVVLQAAMSFVVSPVIFVELADVAANKSGINLPIWWTMCYMAIGGCAGAILYSTTYALSW